MRDLNYGAARILRRNRDGSYATQAARSKIIHQACNELHTLGYRNLKVENLKQKHIKALVGAWQSRSLTAGTIKNRMAHLRWLAEHIGKPGIIPKDNESLGIADRIYVDNQDKGQTLQRLDAIHNPYIQMSLRLQAAFGLRRCEAIKFIPQYADRGDHLQLKPSWTKGGRARTIPVTTDAQRQVLNEARQLVGGASLIPSNKNYVEQLRVYERVTAGAGFSKLHGLRHRYAQDRYYQLTGWRCPAQGGPSRRQLLGQQRDIDTTARLTISEELGHSRLAITSIYLGT